MVLSFVRPGVTTRAAVVVAVSCLLHSVPAAPQEEWQWAKWGQVQRFRGVATIETRGWRNWNDGVITDKADEFESSTLSFVLEREPSYGAYAGSADWVSVGPVSVGGQSSMSVLTATWDNRLRYDASSQFDQVVAPGTEQRLSINYETGEFELLLSGVLEQAVPEQWSRSEWRYMQGTDTSSGTNDKQSFVATNFHGEAPRDVGPLTASVSLQYEAQPDDPGDMNHSTVGKAQLWPEYADVEVVVYIDGRDIKGRKVSYADWLPEAVRPPEASDVPSKVPGSRLTVRARLQTDTGGDAQLDVDRFTFRLADTSQEPQVAMNWPQFPGNDSQPRAKDLRFEQGQGVLRRDGQGFEAPAQPDADGYPSATAVVGSYDFGGWADLTVEAELADGRVIAGHLAGDKRIVKIPLPRRTAGSHIASAWKEQHGIKGADDDDDEKEPVGEPGCDGDGLTLYEEYRGFFENGRHFRADPKRKELFVYNECGAVAKPGIALFGKLSGLKVHQDLRDDEETCVTGEETLAGTSDCGSINGNTDRGAHRVLQHRVDILVCDATVGRGGGTIARGDARSGDVRLRPKDVENIYVEGAEYEFWANQYGVRERDKPRQFDVAMAHELFHAVGGEHHGESDYTLHFEPQMPGEDGIEDYHWYASGTFGGGVVRLFDEKSKADISVRTARRVYREQYQRDDTPAAEPTDPARENAGIGSEAAYPFFIGDAHGAHSGDESCVMRYWLADLFPKEDGARSDFFIVPDGTEPVGNGICEGWAGSTINKDGRDPQPRYFDAHALRGNCKYWVCVNDAIPGVSSKLPDED